MESVKKWPRRQKIIMATLILLAITAVALFILWGLKPSTMGYTLPRRLKKVAAITITGAAIAISSLLFQTVTNNRILTPSVMGLDSLYQFLQTIVVFLFGGSSIAVLSTKQDFFLSSLLMIAFSLGLYKLVFSGSRNLFTLVLVGMVFGSFFGSLSTFMQSVIDPNEFLILQGKMFASFNNVNSELLLITAIAIFAVLGFIFFKSKMMDVLALGRENAINLGVDYDKQVLLILVAVSVLVSIATALVGPVTFLGVLVVNLARQLFATHRHSILGAAAALLSIIALVGGQFLVERVFQFETTVSVIVNFVGGIYFLFLLLKERSL